MRFLGLYHDGWQGTYLPKTGSVAVDAPSSPRSKLIPSHGAFESLGMTAWSRFAQCWVPTPDIMVTVATSLEESLVLGPGHLSSPRSGSTFPWNNLTAFELWAWKDSPGFEKGGRRDQGMESESPVEPWRLGKGDQSPPKVSRVQHSTTLSARPIPSHRSRGQWPFSVVPA